MNYKAFFKIRPNALFALIVAGSFLVCARGLQAATPKAVVSAATFEAPISPDSLASLFGSELADGVSIAELDHEGSLPFELGGVVVKVNGRPAALVFVSPAQINFVVPAETELGSAEISILREDEGASGSKILTAPVLPVAPALFTASCLHPDRAAALNAVTFEPGPFCAITPNPTGGDQRTRLSLFGTGIRGAGGDVSVEIVDRTGNVAEMPVEYAGPAPGFFGLDQINVVLGAELDGAGVVQLRLRAGGVESNVVSIDITPEWMPRFSVDDYRIRTIAGSGAPGYGGDGLGALQALLQGPSDVEIGPDGSLYIADADNHVVRRVGPNGEIETVAGTGEAGSGGDGGLASAARLRRPTSVAADSLGNIYIADAGDHKIRKVNVNGVISTFAGTGVAGYAGDGTDALSAQLSGPSGIEVNPYGSLLIADTGNHRIRLVTADGKIQTLAGTGEAGDSGDGGLAWNAALNGPTSVAVSDLNVVFVADSGNRKIRRIEASGIIRTVFETGGEGDPQNSATPNETALAASLSLALDPNERLLLSEAGNHRLRVFGLDCLLRSMAGREEPGSRGDGGPATEAELQAPGGQVSNVFGDIFVADAGNNRIRQLWRRLGDASSNCGAIAAIAFEPGVAIGGQTVLGHLRLNCPADEDVVVLLDSDAPSVPAPASVTIPAGALTATVLIDTPIVEQPLKVVVTAKTNDSMTTGSFVIRSGDGPGIRRLTIVADAVVGGNTAVGRVTLGGPAPAGGQSVEIASDHPAATTVQAVIVPEGAMAAEFLILTKPVPSTVEVVLTGSTGDLSAHDTLLVLPAGGDGPALLSLTVDPASLAGGETATGTVTADGPAPEGGLAVFLKSNHEAAIVPASIVIAAGESSAHFAIQTSNVQAVVAAVLQATAGNSVEATLVIGVSDGAGSAQLAGLSVSPNPVTGGQTAAGTVELASPAQAGGVLVTLTSDNRLASVTTELLIPEGERRGQFSVTTSATASQQTANLTATSENALSAPLTIAAGTAGSANLAGLALSPSTVAGGQGSTGIVTLAAAAPAGGVLVQLASDNPAATVPPSLVIPAGKLSGQFPVATSPTQAQESATITATSATAAAASLTIEVTPATQATLSGLNLSPNPVTAGQSSTGTVILAAPAPAGGVLVNLSSNNAKATIPGSIVIPAGQTSGQFSVATAPAGAQETAVITATSTNALNASLTIEPTPAGSGQIVGLALSPNTVTSGQPATGTVTLSGAAAAGGILVHLTSDNLAATVPLSIVIPQGQISGQFTVSTFPVGTQQSAAITATSANSVGAELTMNATPAGQGQIADLTVAPSAVSGGQASTGTVTLSAAAPIGGVLIQLATANANATVPAGIVIPQGETAGQFTVSTAPVAEQQSALITATSANSVNRTLTIDPTPAGSGQLAGLVLSPTAVTGGQPATGTVTLSGAAPIGGILVNLSSGNSAAAVPASIVIPQGQASGAFTVTTSTVGAQSSAVIAATSANSVNASLGINPTFACVDSLLLNVSITDLLSGNGVLTATATLDGPAPQGGSQIQLIRAGSNIGVINIPEGQTAGSVELAITNLLALVGSTVQAVVNGCPAVVATITLGSPVTGAVAALTLNPSTVFAGAGSTGVVTLASPAGSNGVLINLSSGTPAAAILSSSVVVPAGQTSTNFPINTVNTSANPVVVEIAASSGSSSKSASLTINSSSPCVESLQLNANITNLITGAGILNALVTLTGPAPTGGANVPLLIGDTQIGQVAIPENQSSGAVGVTLANLPTLVGSVVRAALGPCGVNATISLTAPLLGSLNVPVSLTLGQSAVGTITLDQPAPAGGATVQLTKNPLGLAGDLLNALLGAVVIPNSVTIPEGQTQADFPISSNVVGGLLGTLLPNQVEVRIDAALQSAFANSGLSGVIEVHKN